MQCKLPSVCQEEGGFLGHLVHTTHLLPHCKCDPLTQKHIEIENWETEGDRESTEKAWEKEDFIKKERQKRGKGGQR